MSGLQNWANRYDFVSFTTEATNDYSKVDTYRIVDQNGNTLTPGQSITVSDPNYRISITYYVEKEHTLELIPTSSDGGKILNITANMDADSKFGYWDYPDTSGVKIEENGSSISIRGNGIESSTSFTVTAVSNYGDGKEKKATITVYVSVAEDGTVTVSV